MENFWCTSDTIPDGIGFSGFDGFHLIWLAVIVVFTAVSCVFYRKLSVTGRNRWRKAVAALLVADELFALIPMFVQGIFRATYLPFHLCSINIFIIAIHCFKPCKLLDNFLYCVCIPGAIAALLFPSWTELPGWNYMNIHSFTLHALLIAYPIVLTAGGDIKPRLKDLPKAFLLLVGLAALALVLNLLLDTNFMFLMKAGKGNPLEWFEDNWGSHLLGFPVLIAAVILVFYAPIEIYRKFKKIPKAV